MYQFPGNEGNIAQNTIHLVRNRKEIKDQESALCIDG